MKNLFSIETFEGARIHSPDLTTIIADRIRGHPLRLIFKKEVTYWTIKLRVTAVYIEEPEPNTAMLVNTSDVTEDMQEFWEAMSMKATEQTSDRLDEYRGRAMRIVDGTEPTVKKKK